MSYLPAVLVIGVIATLVMDFWGLVRKPLFGFPAADYRLVGRWISHLARGRFHHESIAASPAVAGEAVTGWVAHYVTGVAFAAGLLVLTGPGWVEQPTLLPALAFGMVTVLVPMLVMQPAMGLGVALRIQSLLTHAVFGLGLYLGATVARHLSPV
jgi:hypothetical protein